MKRFLIVRGCEALQNSAVCAWGYGGACSLVRSLVAAPKRDLLREGAPLINRRDAIRTALLLSDLPLPSPPSLPARSLACSAGMKGNEPPLRIHFRKIDQPRMDARSLARSLARETDGTQSKMIDGPAAGASLWLAGCIRSGVGRFR